MELTGDFTPDMRALLAADIIISTPEKWDGISRNWHNRSYVTKVSATPCGYFIPGYAICHFHVKPLRDDRAKKLIIINTKCMGFWSYLSDQAPANNFTIIVHWKQVGLIVIDEIHLLGADRGPILEVIIQCLQK